MPGPAAGPADAGLEEGAYGDNVDVFPPICRAEDGRSSNGDVAGAGDPARKWLNAGVAGRGVGRDAMWANRGVNGDVGRETSRAPMGVGGRHHGERYGVREGGGR